MDEAAAAAGPGGRKTEIVGTGPAGLPLSAELLARAVQDPARLAVLRGSGLLDTAPDPVYDRYTRLASASLASPIALFSLVDAARQFFKSALGLPEPWQRSRQTPLSHSFCQVPVARREPLLLADVRSDPLLGGSPAIDALGIVAYLGVPVFYQNKPIGALAVAASQPRAWNGTELQSLQDLALMLQRELAHRDVHTEMAVSAEQIESRNRLLLTLFETMTEAVLVADASGRITFQNGAARNAFQELLPQADPATGNRYGAVDTDGETALPAAQLPLALALRGERLRARLIGIRRPGPRREVSWYSVNAAPMRDGQGRLVGALAVSHDMTAERQAQQSLAASEQRIRAITDNLPALICYIDRERRFRFNNATYTRWLKRTPGELLGSSVLEVQTAAVNALTEPFMQRAFAGEHCEFEYEIEHEGELRHVRGSYVPDIDANGTVVGIYGLTQDATSVKQIERELRRLAQYDSLTGVANRNLFNERLERAIARSQNIHTLMAVVFLDLDRFKSLNDSYGHQGGDEALKEFARRLQSAIRARDLVARLAGDEFVLILETLETPASAEIVARRVLQAMQVPFVIGGSRVPVSCSLGIAVRQPDETDPEALLHRADQALYAAKAAGRGRFAVAG